jgi:hypothetical protein
MDKRSNAGPWDRGSQKRVVRDGETPDGGDGDSAQGDGDYAKGGGDTAEGDGDSAKGGGDTAGGGDAACSTTPKSILITLLLMQAFFPYCFVSKGLTNNPMHAQL